MRRPNAAWTTDWPPWLRPSTEARAGQRALTGHPEHVAIGGGGGGASLRLLRQRLQGGPRELLRQIGPRRQGVGGLLAQVGQADLEHALVRERRRPADALVDHAAERVEIAGLGGRL